MTCTYTFPAESSLTGAADRTVLGNLKYGCGACEKNLCSAEQVRSHIEGAKHKKALEKKSWSESPTIQQEIDHYHELETPHREDSKIIREAKQEEFQQKKEVELAAMSPAERQASDKALAAKKKKHELEKAAKAKAQPPAKKAKTAAGAASGKQAAAAPATCKAFHCKKCDVTVNSEEQMKTHKASKKHLAQANAASNAFHCKKCDVQCTSSEQLKAHKQSKKHAAIAQKNAGGGKGGGWGSQGGWGGGGDNWQMAEMMQMMMGGHGGWAPMPKGKGKGKGKGKPKAEKGECKMMQGCAVCGITTPLNPNHVESKAHREAAGLA